MWRNLVSLSLVFGLFACGDDSGGSSTDGPRGDGGGGDARVDATPDPCVDNGGQDCFELPTAPLTVAGVSDGGTEVPANLNCAPPQVETANNEITMSGETVEITNMDEVIPNVPVAVYYDLFGTPAVSATSNASGAISLVMPQPVPNIINVKLTRDGDFANYGYNVLIDIDNPTLANQLFPSAGRDAAELVAGIIGETYDETKGYVGATVFDCDGANIAHLIGTLSSTPSTETGADPTFVPGAAVYYFGSGAVPLPVPRSSAEESSTNGGFLITRVTPTPSSQRYYVQAWGFLTADAMAMGADGLTLIAELPVVVFGDALHGSFLYGGNL